MNKIILTGNLTSDLEIRETTSGTSVVDFAVASNRKYTDKDGNNIVDFFNITAFGGLAKACAEHLFKGCKICVVGELEINNYVNKDGVKVYVHHIVASEVEFLKFPMKKEESEKPSTQSTDNKPTRRYAR